MEVRNPFSLRLPETEKMVVNLLDAATFGLFGDYRIECAMVQLFRAPHAVLAADACKMVMADFVESCLKDETSSPANLGFSTVFISRYMFPSFHTWIKEDVPADLFQTVLSGLGYDWGMMWDFGGILKINAEHDFFASSYLEKAKLQHNHVLEMMRSDVTEEELEHATSLIFDVFQEKCRDCDILLDLPNASYEDVHSIHRDILSAAITVLRMRPDSLTGFQRILARGDENECLKILISQVESWWIEGGDSVFNYRESDEWKVHT